LSKRYFYIATFVCVSSTGGFVGTFNNASILRAAFAGVAVGTALVAFREAIDELAGILRPARPDATAGNESHKPDI
jgi:hypothetical protein